MLKFALLAFCLCVLFLRYQFAKLTASRAARAHTVSALIFGTGLHSAFLIATFMAFDFLLVTGFHHYRSFAHLENLSNFLYNTKKCKGQREFDATSYIEGASRGYRYMSRSTCRKSQGRFFGRRVMATDGRASMSKLTWRRFEKGCV